MHFGEIYWCASSMALLTGRIHVHLTVASNLDWIFLSSATAKIPGCHLSSASLQLGSRLKFTNTQHEVPINFSSLRNYRFGVNQRLGNRPATHPNYYISIAESRLIAPHQETFAKSLNGTRVVRGSRPHVAPTSHRLGGIITYKESYPRQLPHAPMLV